MIAGPDARKGPIPVAPAGYQLSYLKPLPYPLTADPPNPRHVEYSLAPPKSSELRPVFGIGNWVCLCPIDGRW